MNGVTLAAHEYETALFLAQFGKKIETVPQSHTPRVKSPDFCMEGDALGNEEPHCRF